MTDREMKKLSRSDLLEMLVQEAEENEKLRQEIQKLKAALSEREIRLTSAGSIAEASLQLTDVFVEAQKAAEQYLENIRRVDGECQSRADAMLRETQERCAQLESETEERCAKKNQETELLCEQVERGIQESCARLEQMTREKCAKQEEDTRKLCASLLEQAKLDAAAQTDLLSGMNQEMGMDDFGTFPDFSDINLDAYSPSEPERRPKSKRGLFSRR